MNAPLPRNAAQLHRTPTHPVAPVFIERWSPRAFTASAMPRSELMTMLEAARWAPSAYNIQPWRFVHAMRQDAYWDDFVGLLDPFNARWARNASALIFLLSDRFMPARESGPATPSSTHAFDAGAAWAQLALQATMLGYQAHAMAGIMRDEVRTKLAVPDNFEIEIAIAVGHQASPASLPGGLREREVPSTRLALDQIAFAGRFPDPALD